MEYCDIKSDVCNKTELFCEAHCYEDSQADGSNNIPPQSAKMTTSAKQGVRKATTSVKQGVGKACAYQNFVNDFMNARDSGYDFESDEQMNMDLNSDVKMSQNFMKGQGHVPCEYNKVSLLKWGMKNIGKNDVRKENLNCSRNSLHWEEFFGNVFGYIFSFLLHARVLASSPSLKDSAFSISHYFTVLHLSQNVNYSRFDSIKCKNIASNSEYTSKYFGLEL
jgi:hypothetical protein